MREKHLTYFKVENFKRFESFEMQNIGQFNLILGDNNCGKTTVLEALLFDEDPVKLLNNYHHALWVRGIGYVRGADTNYFKYLYNVHHQNKICFIYTIKAESTKRRLAIKATTIDLLSKQESDSIMTKMAINQNRRNLIKLSIDNVDVLDFQGALASAGGQYVPSVHYGLGYGDDLMEFFSLLQNSTKTFDEFKSDLKLFIPELSNVEVSIMPEINNLKILIIRETQIDQPFPLNMYGEGTIKLFRILLEIAMCKGERLMIDEVDTGVHYSHFKEFWKTILKAAKRNDVQIFATTHNLECLRYLKQCLEDEEMKEYQSLANCFELRELPDKSIKSYNYNFAEFENAIDSEINIRGGK